MKTKIPFCPFIARPALALAFLSTFSFQFPTALAGPAVTSVAAGESHSLFSKSDGSLWVMGYNGFGQLGLGFAPYYTNVPQRVLSSGVAAVAAGFNHSLFRMGRDLWAMGYNAYGGLGDGTTNNHYFPERIFSGFGSGANQTYATVMAGGEYHSLFAEFNGLTPLDRGLLVMGANGAGELGDGTSTLHDTPEQIVSGVAISAVAAGEGHSLFVKANGSLWGMGDNFDGQLGLGAVPATNYPTEIVSSGVTAVAAGRYHSLFVKSDGSLWAMGQNSAGQLGDNSTTDKHTPEQVGVNVVAVAAGWLHSLFIKSDGSLWGMGDNGFGQLGAGTNFTLYPIQIVQSNVVAVTAGGYYTLFIKSDGSLWGMGDNGSGQLGDGSSTTNHPTPFQIVAGPPPRPLITGMSLSGADLTLTGANGVSGELVYTLMGTNLTQPLGQWQPVATNVVTAVGLFTITAIGAVDPAAAQRFYILRAQ